MHGLLEVNISHVQCRGRECASLKELRNMRPDMPLDYALFQLDSTRSRCELWISGGGETEKLASGLLKPFLAHLNAAQEQISSGAQSIRLQAPSVTDNGRNSGAAWFSKGTMERFVRFVSIPEVLERVSAVEAECQRLEEAINILAAEPGGDHLFDTAILVPSGVKKPVENKTTNKTGGLTKELQKEYHDMAEATGDTSKKQLLRAMDGRRVLLQKEQRKALAQAVAAGFNMECMPDLVVFADCFGAIQLRDACVKFMALRKKIQEYGSLIDEMELAAETVSTGLKMNRSGIILLDADAFEEIMPMVFLDESHEKLVLTSSDNKNHDKRSVKGFGGEKGRKLVSKTDTIELPDTFKCQTAICLDVRKDARRHSVGRFQRGPDIMENTDNSQIGKKKDLSNCEDRSCNFDRPFVTPELSIMSSYLDMDKADAPYDISADEEDDLHSDNGAMDSTLRLAQTSSSPMRRSASPFRKLPIGYSPVRRQGVIVTRSFSNVSSHLKKAGYAKKKDHVHSEDSESDEESESKGDSNEAMQGSKSECRRLSVQDAISLFESKRNESIEDPLQKAGQNNHKESGQSGIQAARGKDVLRRWSGPCSENVNAYDISEEIVDVSSTSTNISMYHGKCDVEGKSESREIFHSMALEKSEELPPVCGRVDGDASRAVHEIEKEQLLQRNPESEIMNHFVPQTSRKQLAENSRLQTIYASSVSREFDKKHDHRHSKQAYVSSLKAYSTSQSESHREQVASNNSICKDSVVEQGQALKSTVVKKMVSSEKAASFEQRKTRRPELRLTSNIGVHSQAMEDAVVEKGPYTRPHPKLSPDEDPEMVPEKMVPRESSGTTIPHCHNPHQVKERTEAAICQKQCPPTLLPTNNLSKKIAEKGNVRKSWSTPSDFHLEALAKTVDNKDNEDEEHELHNAEAVVKDLKDHFYEKYRQKRDAKLRQESGFKRAERDAKMKAMQEVLERRKEELTARSTKLNENKNEDSVHAKKPHVFKERFIKSKKEKVKPSKEMGSKMQQSDESRSQQKRVGISNPNLQECQSAKSTRRILKADTKNTKPNTIRKVFPSSQKSLSVMTSHSGNKSTGGSSPISLSKTTKPNGVSSSQFPGSSGIQANAAETLFSPSVSSATEPTKGASKPHSSNTVETSFPKKESELTDLFVENSQLPDALNDDVVAFDTKEVTSPESLVQVSESISGFQENISSLGTSNQHNLVEPSEFCRKNGWTDAIFMESDAIFEAAKVHHEESAEFRTNIQSDDLILKSSLESDAEKINCEEGFSSSSSNIMLEAEESVNFSPGELEETSPIHFDKIHHTEHIVVNAKDSSLIDETVHTVPIASDEASNFSQQSKDVSAYEKTGPEALQVEPMDSKFLVSHLPIPVCSVLEPQRPELPNLDGPQSSEILESSKMDAYDVNLARSFSSLPKALKFHDILNTQGTDPLPKLFVDPQLSLTISKGYHDLPASPTSPSMVPKPSLRCYPQAHPSISNLLSTKPDAVQSRKTWNNSHKTIPMSSQHKEQPKGFKRLLKFGRRSRGSEPSSQDLIAASPSEGDEDGDESKSYLGEDDLRPSVSGSRNAFKNVERGSRFIDFDSINATAPRSFFSLSSFRSKNGESRSRAYL